MTIWDLINRVDDPADLILYDSWGNQIEDPEILKKCVDTFARQIEENFPHLKHQRTFQAIRSQARKLFKLLEQKGIILPPDAIITIEIGSHRKYDAEGRRVAGNQPFLRRISLNENQISFSNLEDLKNIVEQPLYSSLINCPLPKRITKTQEYREMEQLRSKFNQDDMWWPTADSAPEGYALSTLWIPQIDIRFIDSSSRDNRSPPHGSASVPIHEIRDAPANLFSHGNWQWDNQWVWVAAEPQRLPTSWAIAYLLLVKDPEITASFGILKKLCRESLDPNYHQQAMRLLSSHARFGEVTFTPDGTEFGDYTSAFIQRFMDDSLIQGDAQDRIQICHSYRLNECLNEHCEYDESGEHIIDCSYTAKEWALTAVNKLVSELVDRKATLQMAGGTEDLEGCDILPPPESWAGKQLRQLADLENAFEYGQADSSKGSDDQIMFGNLWKAATKESLEIDRDYTYDDPEDKPWLIIDAIGDFRTMFADSPRVIRWQYRLVEP